MPPKDATQMRQPQISFAARKRPRPRSPGPATGNAPPQKKPVHVDPAKLSGRGGGVGATRDVGVNRPRRRETVGAETDEAAVEEEEEEIPLHAPTAGLEDEVGDEEGETKIVPDEREVSDLQLQKSVYTTISSEQDIEVHWQALTEEEKLLRKFDMNVRYGPAIGTTRLARWTRAATCGLDPPADVFALLTGPNGETDRYKESFFKIEGL